MNLEELYSVEEKKKPKNKSTKLILILIAVVTMFIIIIGITISILKANEFNFYVDGKPVSVSDDIYIIKDGKVYLAIKDISKLVGYEYHNGEYKIYSEDTDKCYVENANETVSFVLGSNRILKVAPNSNEEYEEHVIEDTVKNFNSKLYATSEAICKGMNLKFNYEKNGITIYTMSYLSKYHENTIKNYGYTEISNDFNNQKTILNNMFIVKNSSGRYGVIDIKNNEIIGTKYNDIKYIENSNEFWVKDNQEKVGIIKADGTTKIQLSYEDIKTLDKSAKYYIVKQNAKYGVINQNGENIIYPEYDNIGIDISKFSTENISNQYLLYERIIPVSKNGKWGAYDITGKLILNIEYDSIGCTTTKVNDRQVNPVVLIPNYNAIVVCKDQKYGIVDIFGDTLVPIALENVYSITSAGNSIYYMTYKEETIEIEKYLTPDIIKDTTEKNNNEVNQNNITVQNSSLNNNI